MQERARKSKLKEKSVDKLSKEITDALKKKKIIFGRDKTLKLLKNGKCSLVVYANNSPSALKEEIEKYSELTNIPAKVFNGDNQMLAVLCKKPFNISALAIVGENN